MLSDASPDNFIVPPHDYQTGTKVVSFSERKYFETLTDLFMNFYESFIKVVQDDYSYLEVPTVCKYIFSGLINSQGEEQGLELLSELRNHLESCTKYYDKDFLMNLV